MAALDDQAKEAFASAADTSKQLITLATGILALEITFKRDVLGKLDPFATNLLAVSWVLFLLSVIAGVWTLLALTGSLGAQTPPTAQGISRTNVRVPALLQILLFICGLVCTVWFGARSAG
jgi:hypothetical protein